VSCVVPACGFISAKTLGAVYIGARVLHIGMVVTPADDDGFRVHRR
jgi:hypothetical protein